MLGIDFGERRIGLALSDAERILATGYDTLDRQKVSDIFGALGDIISEEDVGQIVIGYPIRTDGQKKPGDKTEAVDAFITELESRFKLPVEREDEAFTSVMAQNALKQRTGGKSTHRRGRGRKPDKGAIDRLAACYILQDWLDRQGRL